MRADSYSRLAALVFTIIALLQAARALWGWDITIGTTQIPIWASWVAAVVAAILAWLGFDARE